MSMRDRARDVARENEHGRQGERTSTRGRETWYERTSTRDRARNGAREHERRGERRGTQARETGHTSTRDGARGGRVREGRDVHEGLQGKCEELKKEPQERKML